MGTDRFYSKELTNNQKEDVKIVKHNFTMMFDGLIPEGREKSLYITKLEEACMWATKAIANEKKEEDE